MSVVEARDLYRFYRAGEEETLALRGVSLSVSAGEIVAIAGPSGSGKSTLLACLAGLDEPQGGTVLIAGERMSHRPEAVRAHLRARHIGVLLQSGNLLGHLDLGANIRLAQSFGAPGPRPHVLLAAVGLERRDRALPGQLSGGESARAALAVAVACRPAVLLADEPTGELDGGSEEAVLALLRDQADAGCAVVLVTHSRRIMAFADRLIALRDGQVAA